MIDAFTSYLESRYHFLSAANSRGLIVNSFQLNDSLGVEGEPLFCDIAKPVMRVHDRVLVLSSGVHGIEGYCGSGLQKTLLESTLFIELSKYFDIYLVHAINPHGFSHGSRVNEDNIDVNRNFIDYAKPLPVSQHYSEFRAQAYQLDWQEPELAHIFARLSSLEKQRGLAEVQRLITQGQYSHARDPFYGGSNPSWSSQLWCSLVDELSAIYSLFVHLDIHTGLGAEGECQAIFTGDPQASRSRELTELTFPADKVIVPGAPGSVSSAIEGNLGRYVNQCSIESISIALEFGTQPVDLVLRALIADCWLRHNPQQYEACGESIKNQLRQAFFVDKASWRQQVWQHSCHYLEQLVRQAKGQVI